MIHYQDKAITLHAGDCLDILRELPDNSVDAIVTDPPFPPAPPAEATLFDLDFDDGVVGERPVSSITVRLHKGTAGYGDMRCDSCGLRRDCVSARSTANQPLSSSTFKTVGRCSRFVTSAPRPLRTVDVSC